MIYMGSKRRIAEEILPIILKGRKASQTFVEPFCGGCNITQRVTGKRVANDIHPELIAMFRALQQGWKPPKLINEDDYKRIKANKHAPPELRGYAGFTHSFGGTFFGTYRRNDDGGGTTKGSAAGSSRLKSNYDNMHHIGERAFKTAMEQAELLKGVRFTNGNYYLTPVPDKSIVYCDPPYEGTSKYKVDKFPHDNFWQWCRMLKEDGHTIFISEYSAPEDFKCVWSKELPNLLSSDSTKRGVCVEKLFTL